MRLLIITQKMDKNDDLLAFFHEWVEKFAEHFDKVTVICLFKGEVSLPDNVSVLSLGKEKKKNRLGYLINFYRYIWRERDDYDAVFIHMNQIYAILGYPLWHILGKNVGLWYAHGSVSTSLKIAEKLVNLVFTSTKSGFRLTSKKLVVVGQGINTDKFSPGIKSRENGGFTIMSLGRIAPVKDYLTLIQAVLLLKNKIKGLQVNIFGGIGLPEHQAYLNLLKKVVKDNKLDNIVFFKGPVAYKEIVPLFRSSDLFVSCSLTGSFDKTILESMSSGLPIISCNDAFRALSENWNDGFTFTPGNHIELATKIESYFNMKVEEKNKFSRLMRDYVVRNYQVNSLINKIVEAYE